MPGPSRRSARAGGRDTSCGARPTLDELPEPAINSSRALRKGAGECTGDSESRWRVRGRFGKPLASARPFRKEKASLPSEKPAHRLAAFRKARELTSAFPSRPAPGGALPVRPRTGRHPQNVTNNTEGNVTNHTEGNVTAGYVTPRARRRRRLPRGRPART